MHGTIIYMTTTMTRHTETAVTDTDWELTDATHAVTVVWSNGEVSTFPAPSEADAVSLTCDLLPMESVDRVAITEL